MNNVREHESKRKKSIREKFEDEMRENKMAPNVIQRSYSDNAASKPAMKDVERVVRTNSMLDIRVLPSIGTRN